MAEQESRPNFEKIAKELKELDQEQMHRMAEQLFVVSWPGMMKALGPVGHDDLIKITFGLVYNIAVDFQNLQQGLRMKLKKFNEDQD